MVSVAGLELPPSEKPRKASRRKLHRSLEIEWAGAEERKASELGTMESPEEQQTVPNQPNQGQLAPRPSSAVLPPTFATLFPYPECLSRTEPSQALGLSLLFQATENHSRKGASSSRGSARPLGSPGTLSFPRIAGGVIGNSFILNRAPSIDLRCAWNTWSHSPTVPRPISRDLGR